MLQIQEITNKTTWDSFLDNPDIKYYPFFQSWNFGVVQENIGYPVTRLGVYDGKKLVGVFQFFDVNAKRGHYLHLRHGPVLNPFNKKVFNFIVAHSKKIAQEKGASFIRISPTVEKQFVDFTMLKSHGFIPAPIHNMDAEICWVLNIEKSEDELLTDMRKSHRYLVRQGFKNKDLRIKMTKDIKDLEKFIPLYKHLSERRHFVPHKGVREEFNVFSRDDQEVLFLAEHSKKIIAGALIAFVGNNAIYRHSASNEQFKNLPAMHLILWEAIKEAKKRKLKTFNFWGIAPTDNPKHPWAGLTLFKTGFGGSRLEFLHAQDLPLNIFYWKTYLIEYISKVIKGY